MPPILAPRVQASPTPTCVTRSPLLVNRPLNVSNDDLINEAERRLGYRFASDRYLEEAMTHASIADHRLASNERMEFFGDAILGYVVCAYLFENFPDLLEGEMTKIKSTVVSRRACAQVSEQLDLASILNLGKGMSGRATIPPSVLAAAFEALIAAIYLDGGMEPTRRFILDQMRPMIDAAAESSHQQNYKSVLQQMVQRWDTTSLSYKVLDEKGPDHSKCFEVCVEIAGRRYPGAWAKSKKEAEQQAALNALQAMGIARLNSNGNVIIHAPDDPRSLPDDLANADDLHEPAIEFESPRPDAADGI